MIDSFKRGDWLAVRVKPNNEQFACDNLRAKDVEVFLPTYREPRKWSDRTKIIQIPLFSGYLFCRFDSPRVPPILTTPGVRDIVSFGSVPAPIPESEINAVRRFISSELNVKPWPFLRVGQAVRIETGPLAGVEGLLIAVKGDYRVVVSISLLQRSVAAELDGSWVRSLGSLPSRSVECSQPAVC